MVCFYFNPYPANIFVLNICLLITSAAYIQVHFRLLLITESKYFVPWSNYFLGSSLIWVHIVYNTGYQSKSEDE